ncbi:uncharacterized protein LOC120279065 [Dioscorea cayenensis subsp. rotundata]|uniref:Uncharacterized protein LOC120279065 n=1 Tax=Dioscorea cayennensis subsp. rotundata TaxID=55577 RepID=A0AB40CTL1_DIOCR|nr:uncharacterized protein LOC120279065 [Dioscorea cayenensis subsp. rotundata]XP_039141852.1 uncharacterized protein LOC120279065 [Dioscorea cayenensis subsp. rotundata]
MHGREGEERKQRQLRHMLQVPSGPGAVTAAATVNLKQNSSDSFVKDGRKIQIGDCALFQAGNAPPFIGLIRWLNTGCGEHLKLGVNWLYRPADIKLSKGAQLEAAPNEVFYSFHRDEIPAASLLHPCKVAFLRKGVELPTGISSFVCRRVYDIANKCLWWLTDQDYINERQEEVDQLLDKTQLEMHAPQSGGRSPKPSNGSSSAQQLKTVSEGAQNSGTSFPQQVKVKKRERSETEPNKRERSVKVEDGDSVSSKLDSVIKGEIAKITEKGGLMSIEGVEKLVHLMQLDRAERKLDLGGRVLLADVISATDRYDCLGRFVQLRGVSVLDEWLQEAHRGKAGDGSSPKESDRPVEELLLALLRALDKLPVNLNALQTCNVGKSVNQLRSHKNLEIQKKARSLVETWKKRVDVEMNKLNDAKAASTWPVKQGFAEVSHGGNRRTGPAELVMKSSITQPSMCKTLSSKPGHTDSITKTAAVIPGPLKTSASLPSPVSSTLKDTVAKTTSGVSEVPSTTVKEEKSSGSNQSQNNSQSCSGDPMKATGSSWKEDARNLTAGPVISCKSSSSVSRHRRASNGFVGTTASGTQKDTTLGKSVPLNRTSTVDKVTQSGLTCERQPDVPVADLGNSSHRLIVRLPNPGRSPARSASGGSFEDPSMTGSRSSSPGVPDKTDHIDRRTKIKGEACRSNIITDGHTDLWQNNDTKEGLVGSDEVMKSQATNVEEETCRNAEDVGKFADLSRTSSSSLGNEKDIVPHDAAKSRNSFSSMNALIESCANEATALSAGDDIGINLLASVAAGEMSKSLASPSGSPGSSPMMEDNETKPRLPSDGQLAQSHFQPPENADVESGKHDKGAGPVVNKDDLRPSSLVSVDDKTVIPLLENKLIVGAKGVLNGEGTHQPGEEHKAVGITNDSFTDCKTKVKSLVSEENRSLDCLGEKIAEEGKSDFACVTAGDGGDAKDAASTMMIEKAVVCDSTCLHPKIEVQKQELVEEGAVSVALTDQHPAPLAANHSDAVDRSEHISDSSSVVQYANPPGLDDSKADKSSSSRGRSPLEPVDVERKDQTHLPHSAADVHLPSTLASKGPEVILDKKEPSHHCPAELGKSEASSIIPAHETEPTKSSGSKVSGPDVDHTEEPASSTDASLAASVGPDCTSKIDFDLNEGFLGDDLHQSEPVSVPQPVCSPVIHLPNLPHFASSSIPHGSPAPITVAAPAKGPFVPPENLLKSKAELGWKGSAATSAFRPAEPRKVLEMPLSTSDVPSSDVNTGKQSRPALDIDLNVPDERVLEDMASQSSAQTTGSESGVVNNRDAPVRVAGGLDLDLNRVDDSSESGVLTNNNRRTEFPLLPVRAAQTSLPNADTNNFRDFDLNGPGIEEAGSESGVRNNQAKGSNLTLLPPIAGLRMNTSELGNVSTWFPPSNSYPAVAIPSFLHDRGEHPYPIVAAAGAQRIPGPATGTTFGADIYRHQVLTSSPAMAFSHTPSFQYAGFPFGSSFPVASNSFAGAPPTYGDSSAGAGPFFPTIPSQIMGPAGAVSSHYHQRPYVISLPESSTTGGSDSNRKWARPGLDLNAGPGSVDAEARDERLSSAPRQLNIASTQAFVEEQARMFQMPGGGLKRKEPEGGWDAERFAYKQSSWH